jgi:general secretion pathway protein I
MDKCSPRRSPKQRRGNGGTVPALRDEKGRSRRARRLHSSISGFTLVEVLVALAVLAIALAAVVRAMGQAIDLSNDLRSRTVALWAAEERATQLQLRDDWPAIDTTDGTMEFGEREWRWREQVSKTPVDELRRVEIEIRAPKSPDVLGHLTVFLRRPQS